MAETRLGAAAISDMTNNVTDFSVDTKMLDSAGDQDETTWINPKFSQYLGYYKAIPELKSAIDAIAKWTLGKGFITDAATTTQLENIRGMGRDTFDTILKNLIIIKKINGDSFAEIIRDPDTKKIVNLKPLDPSRLQIVVDRKGVIKRYEQISRTNGQPHERFDPTDILHLSQRVGDEIHGTSIIEAVEGIILKRNEALDDHAKWMHRNVYPFKIVHLDTDDPTTIAAFITKWEQTVKDKETIFIPKGNAEVEIPVVPNATDAAMRWIEYLSGFFFQALGVPQIIVGGSQEFTEATAKIAYLAFQQSVEEEQRDIEMQLWNQLALRIELEFPASLENELLSDQKKDGNNAFSQEDTQATQGGLTK